MNIKYTNKNSKYICLIIGILFILTSICGIIKSNGSRHYTAAVTEIYQISKTIRNEAHHTVPDGIQYYIYNVILNAQYKDNDGNIKTVKTNVTRKSKDDIPAKNDCIEVEILKDGTVSEYKPIQYMSGIGIMALIGIGMVWIGMRIKIMT